MKRVNGFNDLDRKLLRLGDLIADGSAQRALTAGAEVIAGEARRIVPVDTGLLRDSIEVSDEREGRLYARQGGEISVYVGPVGSEEGGPVEYAKFVEFGSARHQAQPFMRPALANKRDEAARVTLRALAADVLKASK